MLLLDRADFPRDKSCGDGIAPHVFDRLSRIGVTGVEDGWTPLTRLELARGTSSVARPMARPVYVIPREVFDARLVERAVAAGAALAGTGWPTSGPPTTGSCSTGGSGRRWSSAPTVRTACSRGHLGLPDGRRALAIRGYAPTPPERRGTQVIRYGDRRQPSYAWAFDRGDGLSNVGYGELLPATAPTTRPTGPCSSTSSTGCCPAASRPATGGRPTTCRCRAGAGTSRTGRCCWPATRPGSSTR